MLIFFPHPYPDEILYSIFARYHKCSHNICAAHTSQDLFGKTAYAMPVLPGNLRVLCGRLSPDSLITADRLICNNTLFPLHKPFLTEHRIKILLDLMNKSGSGAEIMKVAASLTNSIKPSRFLKYCPECLRMDEERYGEPYWHRTHQVFGVHICHIHNAWLKESAISVLEQRDRRAYYCLDNDQLGIETPLSKNVRTSIITWQWPRM